MDKVTEARDLLAIADELQAIREGVDAFNPDARFATRAADDAAERVWKMVPKIIAALRAMEAR